MSWIHKIVSGLSDNTKKLSTVPEGLWINCSACSEILYRPDLEKNLHVCPKCNHHMRISARKRLLGFLDEDSSEEIAAEAVSYTHLTLPTIYSV